VETVIIDGRIIMLERNVVTLDERRIIEEARDASEKLLERAGINIDAYYA
jgi:hypothetical protein